MSRVDMLVPSQDVIVPMSDEALHLLMSAGSVDVLARAYSYHAENVEMLVRCQDEMRNTGDTLSAVRVGAFVQREQALLDTQVTPVVETVRQLEGRSRYASGFSRAVISTVASSPILAFWTDAHPEYGPATAAAYASWSAYNIGRSLFARNGSARHKRAIEDGARVTIAWRSMKENVKP